MKKILFSDASKLDKVTLLLVPVIFALFLGFTLYYLDLSNEMEFMLFMLFLAAGASNSVQAFIETYNILYINGNKIRYFRRLTRYKREGRNTLMLNNNLSITVENELYILRVHDISAKIAGMTYLVLANYPITLDYELKKDKNAIIVRYSEKFVQALEESFVCRHVYNEDFATKEDFSSRIFVPLSMNISEKAKKKKYMLINYFYLALAIIGDLTTGGLVVAVAIRDNTALWGPTVPVGDKIIMAVFFAMLIFFIIWGFGYYVITPHELKQKYLFVTLDRVHFDEIAEVGYYDGIYVSSTAKHRSKLIYFAKRQLTEEERESINLVSKKDIRVMEYTKRLYGYITEELGIEVNGAERIKGKK